VSFSKISISVSISILDRQSSLTFLRCLLDLEKRTEKQQSPKAWDEAEGLSVKLISIENYCKISLKSNFVSFSNNWSLLLNKLKHESRDFYGYRAA